MSGVRIERDLLGEREVPADALLESLDLLAAAARVLRTRCVEGMVADEAACARHVRNATAAVAALVVEVGHDAAEAIAREAAATGLPIRDVALRSGAVTGGRFDELTSAEAVTRLGSPKGKVGR